MILKKRLLSLILLATLLVGMMCPIGAANDTGEKAEASQGAIVYIPLDDRPLKPEAGTAAGGFVGSPTDFAGYGLIRHQAGRSAEKRQRNPIR